jgi:hypothetical protein
MATTKKTAAKPAAKKPAAKKPAAGKKSGSGNSDGTLKRITVKIGNGFSNILKTTADKLGFAEQPDPPSRGVRSGAVKVFKDGGYLSVPMPSGMTIKEIKAALKGKGDHFRTRDGIAYKL